MAIITHQQLPALCIAVQQQAWMFTAKVLKKGCIIALHTADLEGITNFINVWQVLRQAGPVFLKLGISQQYEPLTWERAAELYRAEIITETHEN